MSHPDTVPDTDPELDTGDLPSESDPDGPSQAEVAAYKLGERHARHRMRSMIPRRGISIGVVASLIGMLVGGAVGIVGGTLGAVEKMETISFKAAEEKVAPLRMAFNQHIADVEHAMGPNGPMGRKTKRDAAIDAYLVRSVWSICLSLGDKVKCSNPSTLVTDEDGDP